MKGYSWDTSKPHLVIIDENGEKYVMDTVFSIPSAERFIKRYLADEIEPFRKSVTGTKEKVPDGHDEL